MSLRRWAMPLVLCLTSAGFAQQSAAPAAQHDSSHLQLSRRPASNPATPKGKIKIDVVVTDAAGHPVAGLQQQDFTLLDNKKPQPIRFFQAISGAAGSTENDPPVEVILLVDEANNLLHNIAYERYQIDRFLRQNGGRLAQPVTLMIFNDRGVQAQPQPKLDGNAVAKGFDQVGSSIHTIPVAGGYDAIERLQLSLKMLRMIAAVEAGKPGRKLLIWIGPGWPMLAGPGYQQSERSLRSEFITIVEVSQLLREARVTLYNINAFDPASSGQMMRMDYYKSFLKPVKSVHEAQTGNLSVPVFAVHSGGLVLNATGNLATFINTCVAEAKAYYTIGFDPARAEHTDEYHALEVTVDKPGLKARTNTGYYAEPLPKP
ncbi:MAG: VWA domain-containing protein [Acidobacteriaceae bacterium]